MKKKTITHDNRSNSKIQKLLRQDALKTQAERREIARLQAERMKRQKQVDDAEHERMKSFKLSDDDYEAMKKNRNIRSEGMNYGPSSAKQKAMRRNSIIYVIQSTVTGEVQEIKFRERMAAHLYFIGNRFEVIRYEEFKALSHGYKDFELDPSKSAKAAREQFEADSREAEVKREIAKIERKGDRVEDYTQQAFERAEAGLTDKEEAEEYGISLE